MLHVVRVFTGPGGEFGNPLGVVLDGQPANAGERQAIATALGYSETVFLDDAVRGELRIFTPAVELPFAGHPMVGTAWLLGEEGNPLAVLRPPAGEVDVRREDGLVWIAGRAEWVLQMQYEELASAPAVDELDPSDFERDTYAWAWIDEAAGTVRTRGFFPGEGIDEDEATGSAALALCVAIGRDIEVRQGRGSVIHAHHLGDERAEVGGAVVLDEVRELG